MDAETPPRSEKTSSSLRRRLEAQSPITITTLGMAGVVVVATLDLLTRNGMAFSLFYLVPVAVVAWFGSSSAAMAVAIAGGIASPVTESLSGVAYDAAWIPFWNIVVRTGTYGTVAILATRLRRSLEHERTLSRTDALTGVANSRHFSDSAQSEIGRARRTGRPLSIAYLDIDNFKLVNDDFGHAAGDDLLRRAAMTLVSTTRRTDIVGRLGGDEFAVLLPETGSEEAVVVLNRLHEALGKEIRSRGHPVTTSMGAITFNKAPPSVDDLLWPADQLMYAVKRVGKDGFRHRTLGDHVQGPPEHVVSS